MPQKWSTPRRAVDVLDIKRYERKNIGAIEKNNRETRRANLPEIRNN
jgi:hypothetical protein